MYPPNSPIATYPLEKTELIQQLCKNYYYFICGAQLLENGTLIAYTVFH